MARHGAGELIEVDNVTLAELEAGGFVATEEEDTGQNRDTERPDRTAKDTESASGKKDDKGSGGSHPDSSSWPPVT